MAVSMVQDGIAWLVEHQCKLDLNRSAQDFYEKLEQEIRVGLH